MPKMGVSHEAVLRARHKPGSTATPFTLKPYKPAPGVLPNGAPAWFRLTDEKEIGEFGCGILIIYKFRYADGGYMCTSFMCHDVHEMSIETSQVPTPP